ncbi:hypothetical protein ACIPJN_28990 [Streptomyces sp. NPDC086796]|uniref:hypothetical protein n=1 Tax=unclassified Streptomyces TaxID=2593676 RepID=UPI003823AE79
MATTPSATPGAEQPGNSAARCDSYAYTRRRGGCGALAAKLVTVTFAERRTQRYRLCDRHAEGVHEDVADPLFAYLRCTGVTESPIGSAAHATAAVR